MPIILITPIAYVDIILAIDICPVEVSGLGDVERHGDEWRIESAVVIPQTCGFASTRFDELAYNRYLAKLAKQGRTLEVDSTHLWWHSHVNDKARFSLIDLDYIENTFGKNVPCSAKNPWLVSIVGNKSHRLDVSLDIFRPEYIRYEHIPIFLTISCSREDLRKLYEERKLRMETIISELVVIKRGRLSEILDDDEEEEKDGD